MLQQEQPDDYVLASGVPHTVAEFAQAAFACVDLEAERYLRVDPALVRAPERTPSVGDPSKARERLGWKPLVSFPELVERMVRADLRSLQGDAGGSRDSADRRSAGRRARRRSVRASHRLPGSLTTIGVIGLGYVGLPLAVAFAGEGCDVVAVDRRCAQDRRDRGGGVLHRGCLLRARCGRLRGRIHATTRYARLGEGRRGADLRADAADAQPRARPRTVDRFHARTGGGLAGRSAGGARVDDLPGHDAGAGRAAARRVGAASPAGISIWRSARSASIRAVRTSRCATPRRSSVA